MKRIGAAIFWALAGIGIGDALLQAVSQGQVRPIHDTLTAIFRPYQSRIDR